MDRQRDLAASPEGSAAGRTRAVSQHLLTAASAELEERKRTRRSSSGPRQLFGTESSPLAFSADALQFSEEVLPSTPRRRTTTAESLGRMRGVSLAALPTAARAAADGGPDMEGYKYQASVFGRYRNQLGESMRDFAAALKEREKEDQHAASLARKASVLPSSDALDTVQSRAAGPEKPYTIFLYLTVLGFLTACVASSMDILIAETKRLRDEMQSWSSTLGGDLVLWCLYTLVLVALSIAITRWVSPAAAGSGIPEMKSLLSGVKLGDYLSTRTLIAKYFGLTAANASGMFLGKEGPFAHVGAAMARLLMTYVPPFRNLAEIPSLRQQMLAAGAGAGVASTFGSPIGGTIFTIEVTSTYYPVRNLPKALLAGTVAALFLRIFHNLYFTDLGASQRAILFIRFEETPFDIVEMLIALLLGSICGVGGAMFTQLFARSIMLRRRYGNAVPVVWSTAIFAVLVSIAVAVLTHPEVVGEYLSLGGVHVLEELFAPEPLDHHGWSDGGLKGNLARFAAVYFVLAPLCVSLPFPAGLITPVLAIGAALGRLTGELAFDWSGNDGVIHDGHTVVPAAHAIIGASAFAAAVTHKLSSVAIVLEVIGSIELLIPSLVASIVARRISKIFGVGIYENILIDRGLPYLPEPKPRDYARTVADMLETEVSFLTYSSSIDDVGTVLGESPQLVFPVLNNLRQMVLVGMVRRSQLEEILLDYYHHHAELAPPSWQTPMVSALEESRIEQYRAEQQNRRGFLQKKIIPLVRTSSSAADATATNAAAAATAPPTHATEGVELTDVKPETIPDVDIEAIVESVPIQLHLETPLEQVMLLFITLQLHSAFVTSATGRLVGIVSRDTLRDCLGGDE